MIPNIKHYFVKSVCSDYVHLSSVAYNSYNIYDMYIRYHKIYMCIIYKRLHKRILYKRDYMYTIYLVYIIYLFFYMCVCVWIYIRHYLNSHHHSNLKTNLSIVELINNKAKHNDSQVYFIKKLNIIKYQQLLKRKKSTRHLLYLKFKNNKKYYWTPTSLGCSSLGRT